MNCSSCGGSVAVIEIVTNAVKAECTRCGRWGWIPIIEIQDGALLTLDAPEQLELWAFDHEAQKYKRGYGRE